MKALLLSAGFGTRLGALTKQTPKCLITVGDQPMLDHWLYKLERLGVSEFIINTHYLAEKVHAVIAVHPLKEKVIISHEPDLLGTAKTLFHHLDVLEKQDSFVVHVVIFCADQLDDMVESFRRR